MSMYSHDEVSDFGIREIVIAAWLFIPEECVSHAVVGIRNLREAHGSGAAMPIPRIATLEMGANGLSLPSRLGAEDGITLAPLHQCEFQTHCFRESAKTRFVQLADINILQRRRRECAVWTSCEIQPIEQRLLRRGAGMCAPTIQVEPVLQSASLQNVARYRAHVDRTLGGGHLSHAGACWAGVQGNDCRNAVGRIVIGAGLIEGRVQGDDGIAAHVRNCIGKPAGRRGEAVQIEAAHHRGQPAARHGVCDPGLQRPVRNIRSARNACRA